MPLVRSFQRWCFRAGLSDLRGLGSQFPVGCLVKHPLFGVGTVQAILPRGSVTSARVSFRTVGVKTLVLEYAKLVRLQA